MTLGERERGKEMAKISANGATEVARIETRFKGSGQDESRYLWVVNSKGVVLRRLTGEYGSGYTVYRRHQTASRNLLVALARRAGHEVIAE